jgi:hypothetical protein
MSYVQSNDGRRTTRVQRQFPSKTFHVVAKRTGSNYGACGIDSAANLYMLFWQEYRADLAYSDHPTGTNRQHNAYLAASSRVTRLKVDCPQGRGLLK